MAAEPKLMRDVRRISAIALWVSDLERSAAFYRDIIGVPLVHSDPHEPENVEHYETMWGEWDDHGPVEPDLWFNVFPAHDVVTRGASLSFPVPSLAEVHALATKQGVTVRSEPTDVPWGRSASYEDPDGNLVTVTER